MAEERFSSCVPVKEFVEKRAVQIADLLKVIDNSLLVSGEVTKGPRTAAQRLPRHMRRRAMAYEIKRFPKGFRNFASNYLNSNHRKKPPCRYFRRRSRNLLLNYIRRQKKCTWLETHIWHAKRFYMTERYGYRIPDRSFQRNFRPIYRSSIRHCTVRDKSYLNCLMITGPSQEAIIEKLKIFCCNDVSPTFAFKSGRAGRYEISTLLYKPNSYPRGLIGPAKFLWSERNGKSILSLWIHPTMSKELMPLLASHFELIKVEEKQSQKVPSNFEDWKIMSCQIGTAIYKSKDGLFTIEDLKDQLVRFRFYGPKSLNILKSSFKLSKDEEYKESHEEWNNISSANDVVDSHIISLLIEDPRISYAKETKIQITQLLTATNNPSVIPSKLWDREERLGALKNRLSDAEMNKLKEKLVSNLTETAAKIPILVVFHNLGTGKRETLDGLEIIAPTGFGRDLWVSAQLKTAHASGFRDDLTAHLESGCLHFPSDYIETTSGKEEEKRLESELMQKYLKRPHNRRVKFWRQNAIKYVYSFELQQLVFEWSKSKDETYLLKNRRALVELDEWLRNKSRRPDKILSENKSALINIKLTCCSRGKPGRFAIICLPTKADLIKMRECQYAGKPFILREKEKVANEQITVKEIVKDNTWEDIVSLDLSTRERPISLKPLFPDNKNKDKTLKRKIQNKKKKEAKKKRVERQNDRLRELNQEEKEKNSVSYRDSPTRKVVGRVLRGDFSLTEARGIGIGVIPLEILNEVISTNGILLVRNITSNYYHPVKISILKNVVEL